VALALFIMRRLGTRTLSPVVLLSLVATSLAFRLAFEENLFGYYFMATAIALILLDVASGRLREVTIAWLGLETLAFNPVHLGFISNLTSKSVFLFDLIPIVLIGLAALSVVLDARRSQVRLYKLLWIVLVSITCESKIWGRDGSIFIMPSWVWQLILVSSATALAVSPLFKMDGKLASPKPEVVNSY
jgi:hypothetical protein